MATLGAEWLSRGRRRPRRVGFFGTGLIARYVHTFLAGTGWSFDEVGVHDLSADSATGFCGYLDRSGASGRVTVHDTAEQLIRSSDMVVFATIAGEPHVSDRSWFEHNPLVLHVSLRDLAPEIVLSSTNVVDDVEHCLKANTSPHLAEQLTRQPRLRARHARRRDGRACDDPAGPARGVLAVRPRRARPRGRQVRLRPRGRQRRAPRRRRLLPRDAQVRVDAGNADRLRTPGLQRGRALRRPAVDLRRVALPQVRGLQLRRLDQGEGGDRDGRGRRAGRAPDPGVDPGRVLVREPRRGAGHDRRQQGLPLPVRDRLALQPVHPAHDRGARQQGARDPARRGGRARRPPRRADRLRPQAVRLRRPLRVAEPVQQRGQLAGALPPDGAGDRAAVPQARRAVRRRRHDRHADGLRALPEGSGTARCGSWRWTRSAR